MVHRRHIHIGIGIIVAIAIVIAALSLVGGAIIVNSPTTITVTSNPSVIKIGGSQYTLYLHGVKPIQNVAYLYIGKSPVFINSVLNVTLPLHNYTKVNDGTAYANMEILLNSMTNKSASITITPLQAYLAESADSSRIVVLGPPVINVNASTSTTIAAQSTSITTTISQQSPTERILAYLRNSEFYSLMQNYSNYYANTQNCTPTQYDNVFFSYTHNQPTGPSTYQNVSIVTPYNITMAITNNGEGNYAVKYSTVSHSSISTGVALTLIINLSTGQVLNETFAGAFKDQNYSTLSTALLGAQAINNACSIMIG
ncbi:MAG: hypothetical protein M1528_01890 [Candidatus Marsarchaeota archaeon]|nr:hypothetical protein [Candidatus Marsarchaeota archaeon]MCL5115261.1 hypothetical protein [Candidatus Marsarchaeota archaeon]